MEIAIGLPNTVRGATGDQLIDWARAADEAGFSSLGTIDRIVYPNYKPLVALSAAAAVTDRIRLATTVMLGPLRGNPAMVAKQMLSLDTLAGGGRAVLGIGLGAREDDYEISGVPMSERGRWLDDALPRIRRIWNGEGESEARVGPRPERGGLGEYYAWLGDELAGMIVDSAANDADTVREYIEGFEAAGCDEIFFFPSSSDPAQVGVLAEAAGL
jgi:alkanesulfonate monooxygenase SsuD/methylene tetrahydromethanopterin reductase-like flavin-dependent oxidoreductase (luciferase family)